MSLCWSGQYEALILTILESSPGVWGKGTIPLYIDKESAEEIINFFLMSNSRKFKRYALRVLQKVRARYYNPNSTYALEHKYFKSFYVYKENFLQVDVVKEVIFMGEVFSTPYEQTVEKLIRGLLLISSTSEKTLGKRDAVADKIFNVRKELL